MIYVLLYVDIANRTGIYISKYFVFMRGRSWRLYMYYVAVPRMQYINILFKNVTPIF